MGDVVNLRRVRKDKARQDDSKRADANRAKFGQTKAEKNLRKAEETRADKAHDAHKIDNS
jgi:hypothetical protein